jgi:hypothetical protein
MASKVPYAVVRIRDMTGKDEHKISLSIPSGDIFLTMARTETDAFDQAGEIGWRLSTEAYDSVMAMANPNHGTTASPVYSRPTFVENTLGTVMKYLLSNTERSPEYVAVPVTVIGDQHSPETKPYILAWGGTTCPFVNPQVVCCYAHSYAEMMTKVCMSDDFTVSSFMAIAGMSIYPTDIIVPREDPFRIVCDDIRVYAALPRSISPVMVSDPDPVARYNTSLTVPGPARVEDRMMELV